MRKQQLTRLVVVLISILILALSVSARIIQKDINLDILKTVSTISFWLGAILLCCLIIEYLLSNKIYRGLKYFCRYVGTKNTLELQMIDAGIYLERGNILELPVIKLNFDKDLSKGILSIRNSIKFDKKLDDMELSSALGKYIVERHYVTDDGNYYIYEIIDGSVDFKLKFDSFDSFLKHNQQIPTYSLFLDKRSIVKLQHTLLVGVTGSGKTYCLYNLLLQFYNKIVPYQIYYADPKGSSLAVIGQLVEPKRTAVDVDKIIELLEEFVEEMRKRKEEIKVLLQSKLDADYSDFGKPPFIFCFDEYASFVSVLANEDKKTRDKVNGLMSEVILQGRQLGFFMLIIMQKSDANLISTSLRDNIPLKIVLGNSEQQTYVTAFGTGVDIPKRHYKVGEGVFTEPVIASDPKLVQCPFLNFDILEAVRMATPVM